MWVAPRLCGGFEIAAARPTSSHMEKRNGFSAQGTAAARENTMHTENSRCFDYSFNSILISPDMDRICLEMLAAQSWLIATVVSEFIVCLL